MSWIGWVVFSILVAILLFLFSIPFVFNVWVGVGCLVFGYLFFVFLIWITDPEMSLMTITRMPFVSLFNLIKRVFKSYLNYLHEKLT